MTTPSGRRREVCFNYTVTKPDGTPVPGPLFVLNYGKDNHARVAVAAYADACESTDPVLAIDLRSALAKLQMTVIPTEHQPANPDVWRSRFAAHIEGGIRSANLAGDQLDTAHELDRELTRAFATYLNSVADNRRRRFLLQINTIAAHAYAFYTELDRPELRLTIESILFDLGGLAAVLTSPGRHV